MIWPQVYRDQRVDCGALKEMSPIRLGHLNTWPPGARTICGGLGDMTLLEMCHWVQTLRFQKTHPISMCPLPSACRSRCGLSAIAAAITLLCHC